MPKKKRVLILCTGNSARSQMAEGVLRHDAGDRFEVFSAGVEPSGVRPEAITVMKEIGIDLGGHRAKHVNEFRDQNFDYVLTVCDHAPELCPVFARPTVIIHHSFTDPTTLIESEQRGLAMFRSLRDEIRRYLAGFSENTRNRC